MDNRCVLNLLMDGLGLVDNGGINSLALNNRLDCKRYVKMGLQNS